MGLRRRECIKCGKKRQEKFFVSARGKVCTDCQRRRVSASGKDARLQEQYDITLDEWFEILALQGDCCAICGGTRPTYDTDHDHKLEKERGTRASIRGLLCKRCNRRLLPAALDSREILLKAIAYLDAPPARVILDTEGESDGTVQ